MQYQQNVTVNVTTVYCSHVLIGLYLNERKSASAD